MRGIHSIPGFITDLSTDDKLLDEWEANNSVPRIPSYTVKIVGNKIEVVFRIFGNMPNNPTGPLQQVS